MYLTIALGVHLALWRVFLFPDGLFSLGTLAVNLVGSFVMGLAFVFLSSRGLDRVMFAILCFLAYHNLFGIFCLDF